VGVQMASQHARAMVFAAFFLNQLHVTLALNVHKYQDGHLAHVSAGLDTHQPGCATIQPISVLQRIRHPWLGDYKTTTHCRDVAVLTNTAEPSTCQVLHYAILAVIFILLGCGAGCYMLLGGIGIFTMFVIPMLASWGYLLHTGLFSDYISGAMSWEQDVQSGIKPHNVSLECYELVSSTWVFTILFIFYGIILFIVLMPMFLVPRMQAETFVVVSAPFILSEEDRTYVASQEFKTKCVKAFRDADEDHNGELDLNELQHVMMFDLTETEKTYVQESALFKEAFGKFDQDNSKSIDQGEFLQVMKWIWTKAKSANKQAEP